MEENEVASGEWDDWDALSSEAPDEDTVGVVAEASPPENKVDEVNTVDAVGEVDEVLLQETSAGLATGGTNLPAIADANEGDSNLSRSFNLDSSKYSSCFVTVRIDEIAVREPIKTSRKESFAGLTKSVKDLGVMTPIHLLQTEGYSDWLREHDPETEAFTGYKYEILDGFRRFFAAIKNGLTQINAILWVFNDAGYGSEIAEALGLLLNRTQTRTWRETWSLYEILEMKFAMSPDMLEMLLQLEPGDAMKLKDVALCDYDEIREDLFSRNGKTLDQCYKALQKARKEEDQTLLDDQRSITDLEEASDLANDDSEGRLLSNEDVKEVLEMVSSYDDDLGTDDFEGIAGQPLRQDVDDRRPLDPQLRMAVLKRDNFSCQVCGLGGTFNIPALVIHHLIEVKCGGEDKIGEDIYDLQTNNLITLCDTHHILLHSYAWADCRVPMTEAEYNELPDVEKETIKKTMKLSRIVAESEKRLGGKAKKANHRMPKPYSKNDIKAYKATQGGK